MRDRYKLLILLIGLLVPLLATRPRIFWGDYVEECYEYKQKIITINYTWFRWEPPGCNLLLCYSCPCELIEEVQYYNFTRDTDECLKWHLVRYEDDSDDWWFDKQAWVINSTD